MRSPVTNGIPITGFTNANEGPLKGSSRNLSIDYSRSVEGPHGLYSLLPTRVATSKSSHHGRLDKGVSLITKPFSYADWKRKFATSLTGSPKRINTRFLFRKWRGSRGLMTLAPQHSSPRNQISPKRGPCY